jgi:hypothetical protein
MPIVTIGLDIIAAALRGVPVNADFDATNAFIGVGDSTTAFSAAHTDLQAATNKLRKVVDGAPSVTGAQITLVATFGTGDANFAWEEWGVFNHTSDTADAMLCRKVEALGTKTGSQTWVATVTLTVATA